MNTCALNKLHNTGNEDISAVADSVNLNLFTLNILINQNGLILINLNGGLEIVTKLFFIGNYLHSTATKHKGGTNQHGISNFSGGGNAGLNRGYSLSFGLGDAQLGKQFFKGIAVFCALDSITVGTDDLHSPLHKRLGKIYSGLAA